MPNPPQIQEATGWHDSWNGKQIGQNFFTVLYIARLIYIPLPGIEAGRWKERVSVTVMGKNRH